MTDTHKPLTEADRREILEQIASDPDNYPRDRIAAVRALEAMDKAPIEDELDKLLKD